MHSKFKIHVIFVILLAVFILNHNTLGQTEREEKLLEDQGDNEASELLDRLQQLRQNPLNLNSASLQKLTASALFSSAKAMEIMQSRLQDGPFKTLNDFRKRLKITPDQWENLIPYLTVSRDEPKRIRNKYSIRSRFQRKFPTAAGYHSGAYWGSPWKSYQRLTFQFDSVLSGGIIAEKDPGESSVTDHFSGFVLTDQLPGTTRLLMGQFRMETGQGLVFWGPYGYSKGANPLAPVNKSDRGIVGHQSANENQYFTGGGIETQFGHFRFTWIESGSVLDASFQEDGNVKSLQTSGYHRTDTEIANKQRVQEKLHGGRMVWQSRLGTIGLTGWQNSYSHRLDKEDEEKYHFNFKGTQNHVFGMDWRLSYYRHVFFGEMAQSKSGGRAVITNLLTELSNFSVILSVRKFDPDFQNPHSHSFGKTDIGNETGFYIGCQTKLNRSCRYTLFFDLTHHPWRKYNEPVPATETDFLSEIDYKVTNRWRMTVRMRYRQKEIFEDRLSVQSQEMEILQPRHYFQFRYDINCKLNTRIGFKTRIESVRIRYPAVNERIYFPEITENGLLLYQTVWFKPVKKMTIQARWISFQTDSYDSRIYEFENDLPGYLSIRPFYEQGSRWYILFKWKINRHIQLSVKYASTIHECVDSWGSGYDEIDGENEDTFGIQTDINL